MDIEKELLKAYRESKECMESVSAFEFMKDAALFMKDLKKLVDKQRLPVIVLIGCLMSEAQMLDVKSDDMLLEARIEKSFRLFKRYVDETFIKKEEV